MSYTEPYCMHCGRDIGHSEIIWTGDDETKDGFELWYCCHLCRDSGLPCETFFILKDE